MNLNFFITSATSAERPAAGGQPAADDAASDAEPDGQRLELQIGKPLLQSGDKAGLIRPQSSTLWPFNAIVAWHDQLKSLTYER